MARVVLIEDDERTRKSLCRFLELRGHEVVDFADAGPALRSADLARADVIVTDLMMPTPAEWLIRQIHGSVPVIVMSGVMTLKEWSLVGEVGVRTFLRKPFELQKLADAVDSCIAEAGP
ncbi:MAG: response regulator [bacterium]|nr:response regulator [bacterium]